MQQVNPCIIFHGHGSEYPFSKLAKTLQKRGHFVVEADMSVKGWQSKSLQMIENRDCVLVSAHHPQASRTEYKNYYDLDDDVLNLAQAQDLFRPISTLFIPHDLTCPLHGFEIPEMRRVTVAGMPDASYWFLQRFCRVEALGWIGLLDDEADETDHGAKEEGLAPQELLFFPSEVARHAQNGASSFCEDYAGALAYFPKTKMPRGAGFDVVEQALLSAGCELVTPNRTVADLVQTGQIVICSGTSSVVLEAAGRGARVIAVKDRFADLEEMSRLFGHLPNVYLTNPASLFSCLDVLQRQTKLRLGSLNSGTTIAFNVDRFIELCQI